VFCCGKLFVRRHRAEMLCSPECRAAAKRASQAKQTANRSAMRAQRRAALKIECQRCGQPVAKPWRSTRAFCSSRRRQAAYRDRQAKA
jgi:hypothetical protein